MNVSSGVLPISSRGRRLVDEPDGAHATSGRVRLLRGGARRRRERLASDVAVRVR